MELLEKCAGYELVRNENGHIIKRIDELQHLSDMRDDESERTISSVSNRLDVMERKNEEQHKNLDDKIERVEINLTQKISTMEDNISKKIDDSFEINSGKKAKNAWKWVLGLGGTLITSAAIIYLKALIG